MKEHVKVTAHDGPIFVAPLDDVVGMSVNLDYAHVHVFLTPSEVKSLVEALTGALSVVEGGVK